MQAGWTPLCDTETKTTSPVPGLHHKPPLLPQMWPVPRGQRGKGRQVTGCWACEQEATPLHHGNWAHPELAASHGVPLLTPSTQTSPQPQLPPSWERVMKLLDVCILLVGRITTLFRKAVDLATYRITKMRIFSATQNLIALSLQPTCSIVIRFQTSS